MSLVLPNPGRKDYVLSYPSSEHVRIPQTQQNAFGFVPGKNQSVLYPDSNISGYFLRLHKCIFPDARLFYGTQQSRVAF